MISRNHSCVREIVVRIKTFGICRILRQAIPKVYVSRASWSKE